MKITKMSSLSLADLATEAVRMGRELERDGACRRPGRLSRDAAPVSAMQRRLAARGL